MLIHSIFQIEEDIFENRNKLADKPCDNLAVLSLTTIWNGKGYSMCFVLRMHPKFRLRADWPHRKTAAPSRPPSCKQGKKETLFSLVIAPCSAPKVRHCQA